MISSARKLTLLAGLAGLLALIAVPCAAIAQQARSVGRVPVWALPWRAIDHCAVYGPEFTSVEGTQTCVRIGGHVRVEFGAQALNRAANYGWGRTAPAAMRSEGPVGADPSGMPAAQHLRLRDDDAPSDTGSYLR